MDTNQQGEIRSLLKKETGAKKQLLMSCMFGVFFLATLKDIFSPGALSSSFFIMRIALVFTFLTLAVYLYFKADSLFGDEEKGRLKEYYASPAESRSGESGKQSFIETYLTESDLQSLKKIVLIIWGALFVILMFFAAISFAGHPSDTAGGKTHTTAAGTAK
jgi:hypothetical protein